MGRARLTRWSFKRGSILRQAAAEFFGVAGEEIDMAAPLQEVGMDSVGSVVFQKMVANLLPQLEVPYTLAIDYPTLAQMVDLFATQIPVADREELASGLDAQNSRFCWENTLPLDRS